MPRTSGYTKETFLNAGADVILQKGFDGAGVQDIARASGAPKGSFYNYFESKEHFGAELIAHHTDQEMAALESKLTEFDGAAIDKLRALIENAACEFVEEGMTGCLVGNMCQILAHRSPLCRAAAPTRHLLVVAR